MRLRVPEINEHAVAHILRHEPSEAAHGIGDARLIGRNDLAQVLWVHSCGQRRRTDKVTEHHCNLAALSAVLGGFATFRRSVRSGRARFSAQGCDGVEQLEPMTDRCNAKLLQRLVRQARKNRLVYFILAKRRLIPLETQAP